MNTEGLKRERQAILELFREQRVYCAPGQIKLTPVNAMFTLTIRPGETIKRVRDRLPEISLILSNMRGYPVDVRLNERPLFLDVPHRDPEPIRWTMDRNFIPHHALAGRGWSFQGGTDQWINLMKEPHVLVAGITGSGKSVMILNLVMSLAMGTSPEDLVLVLVDLKNEDLVPLKSLPHVARFAGDPASAADAVDWVYEKLEERRDSPNRPKYRIALVIDELAQLPAVAKETLTQITALGRTMWINVIGGTQHPTAEVLGGSVGKVNYTARLTGMVADASAASTASGRPKTGAEFLPGNGAFIRTGGAHMTRVQSFLIEDYEVEDLVKTVSGRWSGRKIPRTAESAAAGEVRIPVKSGVKVADVEGNDPTRVMLEAYFADHYDGAGGLQEGTLAGAIRIMFGEDARGSGRKYQEQRAVVMGELQEWLTREEEMEAEREWVGV